MFATAGGLALGSLGARAETPFLFGATPVILDDQAAFMRRWQLYLETRLRRPVRMVQRGSYREIAQLLATDRLDCAWLCGYPYVRMKDRLDLVAVPVYAGEPNYRAYLIVPASDRQTQTIADLGGRVFAFADPDSNSGWLTHQIELRRAGIDSERFFKKTFFTWSHRKVVEAVAAGVAHGGAVDGYIWDCLARLHPELTTATRVAWRSEPFGFPPVVARRNLDRNSTESIRQALLCMSVTPTGQALLQGLNLDGFVAGSADLYQGIESNWRALSHAG